jgi:hypothetical protein
MTRVKLTQSVQGAHVLKQGQSLTTRKLGALTRGAAFVDPGVMEVSRNLNRLCQDNPNPAGMMPFSKPLRNGPSVGGIVAETY